MFRIVRKTLVLLAGTVALGRAVRGARWKGTAYKMEAGEAGN
jgi:hypothetical protein